MKVDKEKPLPSGTLAIRALIQSCLLSPKPPEIIKESLQAGEQVLEEVKEEQLKASTIGASSEEEEELSGDELAKKLSNLSCAPLRPSAPSPYNPEINCSCPGACSHGRHDVTDWNSIGQQLGLALPVFQDQQGNLMHQPLDIKQVKQLKEAVMSYGPQAAYTITLLETLTEQNLTPLDWSNLARACLSGGKYFMWKIANQDN